MKRIISLAVAAFATLLTVIPVAQATALGPTNFNVKVNLTAICTVSTAPVDVNFGVYTAFTGAATPAPTTTMGITCTRNLAAPTYAFDAALGGVNGVIAGLNYTLSAAQSGIVAGVAATSAPILGTADVRTITITGGMAAAQAGDCATANASTCAGVQTQVRTLTVTY